MMSGTASAPGSKGSAFVVAIPGIFTVREAEISAGNNTDTRLISTMTTENKKTGQAV